MQFDKVGWISGMLVRPQHFQQLENHLDFVLQQKMAIAMGDAFGFYNLEIDKTALEANKISIQKAHGVFQDGTLIDFDYAEREALCKEIKPETGAEYIYLCIPMKPSSSDKDSQTDELPARYTTKSKMIQDFMSEDKESEEIIMAKLNYSIRTDQDNLDYYYHIPIAHIQRFDNDEGIVLHENFLPPCLNIYAIRPFSELLVTASHLLKRKQNQLANLLKQQERGTVNVTITDTDRFILQIINRLLATLAYPQSRRHCHPATFYQLLVPGIAELSSHLHPERSFEKFIDYNHKEPSKTFYPLISDLRSLLNTHIDQAAISLTVQRQAQGLYKILLADSELTSTGKFILTAKADASPAQIQLQLSQQIKIAASTQINKIIGLQLPGLKLNVLPIAPSAIPYDKLTCYFELDTSGEYWQKILSEQEMCLYLTKHYPQIEICCWLVPSWEKQKAADSAAVTA